MVPPARPLLPDRREIAPEGILADMLKERVDILPRPSFHRLPESATSGSRQPRAKHSIQKCFVGAFQPHPAWPIRAQTADFAEIGRLAFCKLRAGFHRLKTPVEHLKITGCTVGQCGNIPLNPVQHVFGSALLAECPQFLVQHFDAEWYLAFPCHSCPFPLRHDAHLGRFAGFESGNSVEVVVEPHRNAD